MRRLVLGLIAIVGLSITGHAQTRAADDADKQIRDLIKEFVAGFNAGDLSRMMRLYADNYLDVNLKQPHQTKAERTAYYKSILDRHDTTVEVVPEEIITSGEYAFARGSLVVFRTVKGEPKPKRSDLRYIEIWRKFPDGWKSIWGMDAELYPESR